jgi:hypothetical protein
MTGEMILRHLPWRDKPPALKILVVLLLMSFVAALAAGLIVGGIETVALGQPSAPMPIYPHPHALKSVVRYFTDSQEHLYLVAKPIMVASFALCVLLAAAYEMLRRADYNRRKRELLDRVEP